MKTTTLAAVFLLISLLVGCSGTVNFISTKADNSSMIESVTSTPTSQDASGEGSFATEGAAAAIGKAQDVLGKLTNDLSKANSDNPQTTTNTTNNTTNPQVSPVNPVNPVSLVDPVPPTEPVKNPDGWEEIQ